MAVDALPGTDFSDLLVVRVISDVPVKAKKLVVDSCTGTFFNVDPAIDRPAIIEGLESRVLVLTRTSDVATLRFAGSDVPVEVYLFRQHRTVRPQFPRPLQCAGSHTTSTCTS